MLNTCRDFFQRDTTAVYKPHTNGLQMFIPSVSYLVKCLGVAMWLSNSLVCEIKIAKHFLPNTKVLFVVYYCRFIAMNCCFYLGLHIDAMVICFIGIKFAIISQQNYPENFLFKRKSNFPEIVSKFYLNFKL